MISYYKETTRQDKGTVKIPLRPKIEDLVS